MAIHGQRVGLIKESLMEMIHVADYTTNYRKTDERTWGTESTGGILGFPSSVILFSIIDCIGSVFRGNDSFKVTIDGQQSTIRTTSQHIYILNSKYFGLSLSRLDLDSLYKNVRSTLTHNSLLPQGYMLYDNEDNVPPFRIGINEQDQRIYFIYIIPLFDLTKKAVDTFISDLDKGFIDFENSSINSDLKKRDIPVVVYRDLENDIATIRIKKWIVS